jgi:hypothetical protein
MLVASSILDVLLDPLLVRLKFNSRGLIPFLELRLGLYSIRIRRYHHTHHSSRVPAARLEIFMILQVTISSADGGRQISDAPERRRRGFGKSY